MVNEARLKILEPQYREGIDELDNDVEELIEQLRIFKKFFDSDVDKKGESLYGNLDFNSFKNRLDVIQDELANLKSLKAEIEELKDEKPDKGLGSQDIPFP